MIFGKLRVILVIDDDLDKKVVFQRLGLRRRLFSVVVGIVDLGKLIEKVLNEKKFE